MHWFILIVLGGVLYLIAYQDYKYRAVAVYVYILLFSAVIAYGLTESAWQVVFWNSLINSALVLTMTSVLYFLYFLKEKRVNGFFNTKLGMGDLLFWVAVTPLFSPLNYLLWLIFSMIISLVIYLVGRLIQPSKKELNKIPLAGIQAIVLLVIIFLNAVFFHKNLSQDVVSLTELIL